MATPLEIKRVRLDLANLLHGKAQTELRIEEYQTEINKLDIVLKEQLIREEELTLKLKEIESQK